MYQYEKPNKILFVRSKLKKKCSIYFKTKTTKLVLIKRNIIKLWPYRKVLFTIIIFESWLAISNNFFWGVFIHCILQWLGDSETLCTKNYLHINETFKCGCQTLAWALILFIICSQIKQYYDSIKKKKTPLIYYRCARKNMECIIKRPWTVFLPFNIFSMAITSV